MERSPSGVDPLSTVMREGGGYYTRNRLAAVPRPARGDGSMRAGRTHPGPPHARSRHAPPVMPRACRHDAAHRGSAASGTAVAVRRGSRRRRAWWRCSLVSTPTMEARARSTSTPTRRNGPPPTTLPPKSTATVDARATTVPTVEAATAPAPRLSLSPGVVNVAPVRVPTASATVPFSWPAAPTPAPTAPTTPPPTTPPVALRPVVPPTTGVWLGAYPDPFTSNGDSTIEEVLIHLPEFNQKMGRDLAIVSVYQPWTAAWVLNEQPHPDRRFAGSDPDGVVALRGHERADRVRRLRPPHLPVRQAAQGRTADRSSCVGSGKPIFRNNEHAAWDHGSAAEQAAALRGRVPAHRQHLRHGRRRATWRSCGPPRRPTIAAPMETFYPGDEYVDWIGADGYDRQQLGLDAFTEQFEPTGTRMFARSGQADDRHGDRRDDRPGRVPARHRRGAAEELPLDQGVHLLRRRRSDTTGD